MSLTIISFIIVLAISLVFLFDNSKFSIFLLICNLLFCCSFSVLGIKFFLTGFNVSDIKAVDHNEKDVISSQDYYRIKACFKIGAIFLLISIILRFGLSILNQIIFGMDHSLGVSEPIYSIYESILPIIYFIDTLISGLDLLVYLMLFEIVILSWSKLFGKNQRTPNDTKIVGIPKKLLIGKVLLAILLILLTFFPSYFIFNFLRIIIYNVDVWNLHQLSTIIPLIITSVTRCILIIIVTIAVSHYKKTIYSFLLGGFTALMSLLQIFEFHFFRFQSGFFISMIYYLSMIAWVSSIWWTFRKEIAFQFDKKPLIFDREIEYHT